MKSNWKGIIKKSISRYQEMLYSNKQQDKKWAFLDSLGKTEERENKGTVVRNCRKKLKNPRDNLNIQKQTSEE